MSITLSHLTVKVTSKKNNVSSVIKDSKFYFQTPSYITNNFADLSELVTTYEDHFYYADLNYIPITLADFTTNGVAAKIAYSNLTSASGVSTYNLYTNISGWQNTGIAIPNGVSFTITVQKWCAVNFVGSPNGQKAYPEGVYPAFASVTRPPDDGPLDAPEVPGDTQQTIPTGPAGWPAPDKRPFSVVGSIEVAPYVGLSGSGGGGVGEPGLPEPILPGLGGGGGTGGDPTVSFQTNRSYTATNSTGSSRNLWLAFNDDETTSPWNYNDNYGYYIVTVTLGSAGADTVDVDHIEGVLSYWHNDIFKTKTLTVNTVTQEDVTINWNNLTNVTTLNNTPSSSDSFGNNETKLLKVLFNTVSEGDLVSNPGTDPAISSESFKTMEYIPRWTEAYYSNTNLNKYYEGCILDSKQLTEFAMDMSFGPSFLTNKNSNYRKFYSTSFYPEIKTISAFGPQLSRAGTLLNTSNSNGALNIQQPYYSVLSGKFLLFHNLQFIKLVCESVNGEIDLTTQFALHEPLFNTNFYIMNSKGDMLTFTNQDLVANKLPLNLTGFFYVLYESKTLLNSFINNTSKIFINGFPIKIYYRMSNPYFEELRRRFDYHTKFFLGDYDYQEHLQCFAFARKWQSNLASDLNLSKPIVWNTSTTNNLISNNFVYDDLATDEFEVITEQSERSGNDFYFTNDLPTLLEVYADNILLSSIEYTVLDNKITLNNPSKSYKVLRVKYKKVKIQTTYTSDKINTLTFNGDSMLVYGIGVSKIKVVSTSQKPIKTSWVADGESFSGEFK